MSALGMEPTGSRGVSVSPAAFEQLAFPIAGLLDVVHDARAGLRDPRRVPRSDGAARLLRALVRSGGLAPEALPAAAGLVLELDAAAREQRRRERKASGNKRTPAAGQCDVKQLPVLPGFWRRLRAISRCHGQGISAAVGG